MEQFAERRRWPVLASAALILLGAAPAVAQTCTRQGAVVRCSDGRVGTFVGDGILWPDGTTSRAATPHPDVIIGHKPSVRVGPGVFVGGKNGTMVPLEDPGAPNKQQCAVLDGTAYCH